ncbi:acyl-CoA dehydrogenase family protein [Kutzneria kofuensis]|uniref:Medium-chain specific acyl-CoA dehydrogenase, mitochondrial n=1 Tax=Kutzneria kofuensis TaxID=103725 RepID=A0A7W9KSM2_9PSEU|nr:acyl-CoA dehydrogenase family protein [Kutzneria kofuensis]MBB5897882.1 alkylation response protein AidB-like acyl-CoA dehydrogenase [Kutzneria kofuensis]
MGFDPAEAARWDRDGGFPVHVVKQLADRDWLGGSPLELGEFCAEVGAVCSSLRGLVTVQGMVSAALSRWGTADQREHWLPRLAAGEEIAGFAATESGAGTDLAAVGTTIDAGPGGLTINGEKRWVTCGRIATVLLVLGVLDGKPATVLVETDRAGVCLEPVHDQLGMRAAHIADVRFDQVRVPRENLVAPAGFGLSHVVATALDHGRFTVAWGCVGMAEACLRDAAEHAMIRVQAGVPLADHQLVRSMVARAAVAADNARLSCTAAAQSRMDCSPDAIARTIMAKYTASRAAATVSADAVQILGSAGVAPDSRAGRFYRDAKVMRIIEGADQVAELHIADHVLREHRRRT